MRYVVTCVTAAILSLFAFGVSWIYGINPDDMAGWVAIGAIAALSAEVLDQ